MLGKKIPGKDENRITFVEIRIQQKFELKK